jgi:hypothetical protein
MKRFALAILLVTAAAALVFAMLNRPGAEASPDVTITVNSTEDTDDRNDELTLREAMMLATGGRVLSELSQQECGQVSGASWKFLFGPCEADKYSPGAASADTIVFDLPFPSDTVELDDTLPALDTGDDTVDGSADVIVSGAGTGDFDCFEISSNNNTIKGLAVVNCNAGVNIHAGAQHNTIGGSAEPEPERNVISANDVGVVISGAGTDGNVVGGNYIGTDDAGTFAIANRVGVFIADGAQDNTIGGSTPGERNIISGNNASGVMLQGTSANALTGNYIGTNASAAAPIPNGHGVYIFNGAQDNTIGGTATGEGNTIAFNSGAGVWVSGTGMPASRNTIRGNSIHSNGGRGIELVDGGNTELAPPTTDSAGSVFGTACPDCTIDVYSDDEDEGGKHEGSTTADGDGSWSFSGTPEGPNITATATDSYGNTSEFSEPLEPPWPTPTATSTPTPTPTPSATATPSPPVGLTRTLVWGPGWHNETWSGASTPEEAFSCAAGNYAAAYRYVGGGFQRFFPNRLDISNMSDLAQYDTFFILITADVTCEMPVADPPATERTLDWGVGWQNDGWTGPDGTAPDDAFACADGSYAAAYRYVDGGLERHFPDRPDISNMGPLNQHDAFLILVTAPVSCTMPIAP